MLRATNMPIAGHRSKSKLSWLIKGFYSVTWLIVRAVKEYLTGVRYYIHPIHTGKLLLFLKNPENKMNGIMKIGPIAEMFLASAMLPMSNPTELPAKLASTVIR